MVLHMANGRIMSCTLSCMTYAYAYAYASHTDTSKVYSLLVRILECKYVYLVLVSDRCTMNYRSTVREVRVLVHIMHIHTCTYVLD